MSNSNNKKSSKVKVVYGGTEYGSISELVAQFGYTYKTYINYTTRGGTPIRDEETADKFFLYRLQVEENKRLKNHFRQNTVDIGKGREVTYKGVKYKSISKLLNTLGYGHQTLYTYMSKNNIPVSTEITDTLIDDFLEYRGLLDVRAK